MLWKISWRNVWRNKLRSMVVILAVALGLYGGVFMMGLMNGMVLQQISNSINNEISDIQIHNPKFLYNEVAIYAIDNADEKIKEIKKLPGVTAVCKRTKSTAMANTATTGTGIKINGIIPQDEKKVTDIYKHIIDGSYFEKKIRNSPAVISKKLSDKLKAGMGNKFVVTIQSLNGEMTYGLFRVVGIYKTSNSVFDEMNVFVKSSDLNSLIGFDPANTSEIAIRTENSDMAFQVADKLKAEFPTLSVQDWKEIKPSLVMMKTMMTQFGYWLLIIILFALIFGIINAMLMVILERTKEIGMLMAIGMNRVRVFNMIMLETIFLSVTGGVIGVVLSVVTISLTGKYGINFASMAQGLESMGYSSYVYPVVNPGFYVELTILVIITAIIASIWPARKALKLNPAEAIRQE